MQTYFYITKVIIFLHLCSIVTTSKTNCWLRCSQYEKGDQQIYCLTSFHLNGIGTLALFQTQSQTYIFFIGHHVQYWEAVT